jgi:signal transduction histidine kinase/ketosteroid isomerase-like protein
VSCSLTDLLHRYHQAFNDRDFAVWGDVFAADVELVVDGMTFSGVEGAVAYGVGSVTQFPGLRIDAERVVAEGAGTVVAEIDMVNGDPASGHARRQGTACEIIRVRDGRIVSCRSYYMAEPGGDEDAVRVPARGEAARIAEEQAALRRVATLVARGVSQDELFAAINQEVGWLVGADPTSLMRFEPDDTITLVAAWSAHDVDFPIGSRHPVDDVLRSIRESGGTWRWGPAELPASGPFVEEARRLGIRAAVGVPIVVEGRVWGVAYASSTGERAFSDDAEARIAAFAELAAIAIADAQARAELAASRARIVAAADEERRRVVRDLHDGAQQRLVHAIITLKLAEQETDLATVRSRISDAVAQVELATEELRELSQGIMPSVLTRGGLQAGVAALASRSRLPVDVDVTVGRFPATIEATAYFIVAEALTNVSKHARATQAEVTAHVDGGALHVAVRDNGVGGARPDGSGLVGLHDRLAALDGVLRVESRADGGTLVAATIPLRAG